MKKYLSALLLLSALTIPIFAELNATVKSVKGKVEIKMPFKSWQRVKVGMVIPKGATISTGFRSYAVLQLGNSILQVKQLTRMKLVELIRRKNTVSTKLFLAVGKIRAKVRTSKGLRADFKLKSPNSTAAVRGTEFEYDGRTLRVIEGVVQFFNRLNQRRDIGMGEESETDGINLPTGGETGRMLKANVHYNTSQQVSHGGEGNNGIYGSVALTIRIPQE